MPFNSYSKNNKGTGFGGASGDAKSIATSLQKAQIRTRQEDKKTASYLNDMVKLLLDHRESWNFLEDFFRSVRSTRLQNTLEEVLHNHSLTEWEERGEVLMAALRVCQLLASDLQLTDRFFASPQKNNDNVDVSTAPTSLLLAIDALAEQAKLIATHDELCSNNDTAFPLTADSESPDIAISTFLLQVQDEAHRAVSQLRYGPPNMADKPPSNSLEDVYKARLGKLRVDFVNDLPCHSFQTTNSSENNARHLYKELVSYQAALPVELGSSIFVRVKSSQINLIRALIIGPESTPYANGCFIFDICLPHNYPVAPPQVKFCTTGGGKVRFNPNLYEDGKVCLSLLGTWNGPGWIPSQSTLLQVLLSIQSLIFVPDPYFNEPGWDAQRNTTQGIQRSERYNANIREFTLKYAIMEPLQQVCSSDAASGSTPKNSTPEFTQVIKEHFQCKCQAVKDQLEAWFSVSQYQEVQSNASLKKVKAFLEQLPVVTSALENNAQEGENVVPSVSPFSGSFCSPVAQRSYSIDLTDEDKKPSRMPCKPEVIDLTGDDFEDAKACKKQKKDSQNMASNHYHIDLT